MQRFKNILVVCDDDSKDQTALQRALLLARANAANVTLISVLDAAPGDLQRLFAALPGARPAQIADQVRDYHTARLNELAQPFRDAGINVTTQVLEGTAFIVIIERVIAEGHDLLIKGVHDRGTASGLFSRGYDLHLLRKCPCPVWMIKATDSVTAGNILVAVDPDPTDETRDALNTMVMEMATSLSANDGADLHVINVWRLQEEQALHSGRISIDPSEVDLIVKREQAQSKARLDALMARFPETGQPRIVKHIKGLPDEVIPKYAADHRIDTIVMGTVGRTGIAGLFIGNTAEAILSNVACSVLAVKPPGFRSPVASDT